MKLFLPIQTNSLRGGVEVIAAQLCEELPRRGWEVVLGLCRGARFNDPQSALQETYATVPYVILDASGGSRQARMEALLRAIRSLKPAVVFSPRVFDAYPVIEHLKRLDSPLRLVCAAMNFEPQYIYDAALYRGILDGFVTMGELARQTAIHWAGLEAGRVRNIPGGVVPPVRKSEPRVAGNSVRLLYAARICSEQKRVMDMGAFLDELDRLEIPYTLDIVGTGEAESELRERLAPRVHSGRATFHGWQNADSLYRCFFPGTDFLIQFARTEGLPTAPREAMAHGVVPVLAAYEGIYTEGHFRDAENALIFPVGQPRLAAERIVAAWTTPGEMARLSRNATRSQSGPWLLEGVMDTWAGFFDGLMEKDCKRIFRDDIRFPSASRLDRLVRSPWLAERFRRMLRRSFVHKDPGSEWPVSSWLCTADADEEIRAFAAAWEEHSRVAAERRTGSASPESA
jgi:glycosyltransferase involved in cell wall biosynthesis